VPVEKISDLVPCYQVNYNEDFKAQFMKPEEMEDSETFKCKKICGQL